MSAHSPGRLSRFLSKRDYRGADMEMVRRITAAAAFLTAAVIALLSPLSPPDGPIMQGGWAVLAAVVVGLVLLGLRLQRMTELGPDFAFVAHALGIASVALAVWLSDGRGSPYITLFLLWMALAGASHPPRRTFAFIGLAAVLALLPLAYDSWSGVFVGDIALRLLTWSALTLMACVWTTGVRQQRAELIEEEEEAKRQARSDSLTGLGNRRAFDERLDHAIDLARSSRKPLSVIVCDLDDFKQINDAFGHLNGDAVLRSAANTMRAAVRDHDACYRWGGDEFAVLLPGVDQDSAERVAERLSASVVATCTRPDGEPLTLAWGTAELTAEMGASDLLASADLALMTRKHNRQRRGSRLAREERDSETT